jgi:N-methylhydantoinase B
MRAAIAAMPHGTFSGEDFLDDDGVSDRPIAIRVRVELEESRATVDFSATDDAARGPVNTTPFIAAASTLYAFAALASEPIDPAGGALRPLQIITRPRSVLDPPRDRPVVGGNHETSQRIVDAIFKALQFAMPEKLTAGGPTTSGLLLFAFRMPDGSRKTLYETHGGGEGARVDRDGMPVIRVHMSNVMNTPGEIIEGEYPIRILRQQLRRNSGGAGLHRGGDGLLREYLMLQDDIVLTTMFERRIVPPYGLNGGKPGAPFRCTLVRANGEMVDLPGKANRRLGKGDRVIMETSGGGGMGRTSAGS